MLREIISAIEVSMNIRFMFGLAIFCGMLLTSVFGMQGDDRNSRKRKELEPANAFDQIEQARQERAARHRSHQLASQEAERRINEEQEQLRREKQAENLQKLKREQAQFNALEDLISALTVFINELEYAENFDVLCGQLGTIAETVAQSGFDFAELKKSSNAVLAEKVNELFDCLLAIVTKIEANPIAQGACFKLESMNDQLSMICQIVGYEGGIAVELKDMYTEGDEQIAHDEQKQINIAADKELAGFMAEELDRDRVGEDENLAFLLQQEQDAQTAEDDAEVARRLQKELNSGDNA